MIIENPYTQPHYLTMYFPIKPSILIKDRHAEGDYYRKPTQFFFVNCKPEQNVVFEPIAFIPLSTVTHPKIDKKGTTQVKRSLIHPQFAERFILTYILDNPDGLWL